MYTRQLDKNSWNEIVKISGSLQKTDFDKGGHQNFFFLVLLLLIFYFRFFFFIFVFCLRPHNHYPTSAFFHPYIFPIFFFFFFISTIILHDFFSNNCCHTINTVGTLYPQMILFFLLFPDCSKFWLSALLFKYWFKSISKLYWA